MSHASLPHNVIHNECMTGYALNTQKNNGIRISWNMYIYTLCLKYLHTYIKLSKFRAAVQEELRLRKKKERKD